MNSVFVMVALLALLAVIAISLWIRSRSQDRRNSADDSADSTGSRRFDTTMGDLRDLREALRPAERSAAAAPRPTRPRGSAAGEQHRP